MEIARFFVCLFVCLLFVCCLYVCLNCTKISFSCNYVLLNYFRFLEVILIAIVTTSAVFVVAMLLGTCLPDPHNHPSDNFCAQFVSYIRMAIVLFTKSNGMLLL